MSVWEKVTITIHGYTAHDPRTVAKRVQKVLAENLQNDNTLNPLEVHAKLDAVVEPSNYQPFTDEDPRPRHSRT